MFLQPRVSARRTEGCSKVTKLLWPCSYDQNLTLPLKIRQQLSVISSRDVLSSFFGNILILAASQVCFGAESMLSVTTLSQPLLVLELNIYTRDRHVSLIMNLIKPFIEHQNAKNCEASGST